MASELANGTYAILSAYNVAAALDVENTNLRNGTNVDVFSCSWNNAQVWNVTKVKRNGKYVYEIVTRLAGKLMGTTSSLSGGNVVIYEYGGYENQWWDITATGKTVTFGTESYPTYYINEPTYNLNLHTQLTSTSGSEVVRGNVIVKTPSTSDLHQQWAFVPIPGLRSGGVYEIRSMLGLGGKLTLDVDGAYKANGSNVMIGNINHGNNQKFYLTNEGNGWSIRDINSGKYVDVNGAYTSTSGTNVQLWEDNDTRAQRWKVTEYGSAAIGGKQCKIVAFGAGNSTKCSMDVAGALEANRTNVQIYTTNDTHAQKWVLWPTSAKDPNMPVPYDIKLAYKVGGDSWTNVKQPGDSDDFGTLYPAWKCSDAWVTDGANSYRWRWRKRTMKGTTSSWQSWGAWSAWETPSFRQKGKSAWETHGIDVGYRFSDNIKNCQVEFQVCSQGVKDNATENITSDIADQVCGVIRRPTVTITGAAWSYDGLRVSYETDYPYGALTIHLKTLTFAGKTALKKAVDISARSGTFLVPQSSIKSKPKDGAAAALTFALGNDQFATFGGSDISGSAAVAYDAGTVDVTPTYKLNAQRLTLDFTVPYSSTVRMWAVTDGKSTELEGTVKGGKTSFSYVFPFDKTIGVFTSYANSDGSEWGTDYTEVAAMANPHAHFFNWADGFLALWLDESVPSEKRTYSTESEEHVLAGRSHPAVSFLHDSSGNAFTSVSGTAEGVLVPDDKYGCTVDDVEALVEEAHVTYRAPSGRIASVAVTGADIEKNSRYATVSVSYVEEQL